MDRAVVLMSGGINAAVAAAVAREHYQPALLHVAWGHRTADRELSAFESLANHFDIDQTHVAELPCMAAFGGNARVSRRISIEDASVLGPSTPTTFPVALMPGMLSLAAAWAAGIGAKRIIVGIGEDYRTTKTAISDWYPDYKRDFLQLFNLMITYAKPADSELLVEAPLLDLSRCEVVKLGKRLGVPFGKTWSCYANSDAPCCRCLACANRSAGFIQAGIPDPLLLEPAAT